MPDGVTQYPQTYGRTPYGMQAMRSTIPQVCKTQKEEAPLKYFEFQGGNQPKTLEAIWMPDIRARKRTTRQQTIPQMVAEVEGRGLLREVAATRTEHCARDG